MAVSIWTLKWYLIHIPCVAEKRRDKLTLQLHIKTSAASFRHMYTEPRVAKNVPTSNAAYQIQRFSKEVKGRKEGRKEGREGRREREREKEREKERKKGRKEGRKEGRKKERKEERKLVFKKTHSQSLLSTLSTEDSYLLNWGDN
jgi:flagellar biosynthesis/type III secretory pathway protein FliH